MDCLVNKILFVLMRIFFVIGLIFLGFSTALTQIDQGLVAYYSFDACDATDDSRCCERAFDF